MDHLGSSLNYEDINNQEKVLPTAEVIEVDRESGYFSRSAESLSPVSDQQREKLSQIFVPSEQKAIVTPSMGKNLSLSVQTISVEEPCPGEVLLRIRYTGICRSVSMTRHP